MSLNAIVTITLRFCSVTSRQTSSASFRLSRRWRCVTLIVKVRGGNQLHPARFLKENRGLRLPANVQALNRTQPILPLAPGVPARQSQDSERAWRHVIVRGPGCDHGRQSRSGDSRRCRLAIAGTSDTGAADSNGTHKVNKVRSWLVEAAGVGLEKGLDSTQLIGFVNRTNRRFFTPSASRK